LKISLICATYNRSTELEQLLKSLVAQTYKNFEIIVVDQIKNGLIDDICQSYIQQLDLIHIKSQRLGLSNNRNQGITAATGGILGFPDDDCTYYPDTLQNVISYFATNPNTSLVYGKIYNRVMKKNIMRNWPVITTAVTNLYSIMLYSSSIVVFIVNNDIYFDKKFGVNEMYGALEDIDLCYSCFKDDAKLEYCPKIEVNHPEVSSNFLNCNKAYSYGRGWGAFFAKHLNPKNVPLFIGILGYVVLLALRDIVLFRPTAKGRIYSIIGRLNGFYDYLINYRFHLCSRNCEKSH